ncbi:hypothetical protein QR97_13865 [Streptomyces sp. PBH53]|uniref:hypothetical protein n=1 Tax=Streptomyces TaxID=1883 RepID=UPI000655CA76|nr:hypothetical protein [Streptomyces sp. PBH53]AKN70757.1 hypothetical protein QR97_13865 [Streptomyces sp. PBH53]
MRTSDCTTSVPGHEGTDRHGRRYRIGGSDAGLPVRPGLCTAVLPWAGVTGIGLAGTASAPAAGALHAGPPGGAGHPARLPGARVFCRAAPSRTAPGGPNARRTVSDPHPLGEEMA